MFALIRNYIGYLNFLTYMLMFSLI